MAQTALVVDNFIYPDGTPVALGYMLIRLSQDGSVNNTQVSSQTVKVLLDSLGTVVGSPVFWPNASITPTGTYYIQSIYSAEGQLTSGPNKITV
jgi:hypothetical protein